MMLSAWHRGGGRGRQGGVGGREEGWRRVQLSQPSRVGLCLCWLLAPPLALPLFKKTFICLFGHTGLQLWHDLCCSMGDLGP